MNLYAKLIFLNFDDDDFRLQDDGAGAYIAEWYSQRPQPPQAALDAIGDSEAENALREKRANTIFDRSDSLKAVIYATADRLGVDRQTFLTEIRVVFRSLL